MVDDNNRGAYHVFPSNCPLPCVYGSVDYFLKLLEGMYFLLPLKWFQAGMEVLRE
jgi:hypothetical protein